MSDMTTTIYDHETEIPLLRHRVDRSMDVYARNRFRSEMADDYRAEFGYDGEVAIDLWVG